MKALFLIIVMFYLFYVVASLDMPMAIEAKEFEPKYSSLSPKLSPASILIQRSKKVHWCFCVSRKLSLQIANIDYSNDGDHDTVSVYLDETRIGTFTTYSKSHGTQEWNMFLSSGPLDFDKGFIEIDKGSHNLTIELTEGNSKELELNRIDLIVRSSVPRARVLFNKGCQAKNCLTKPNHNSRGHNKSNIQKKKINISHPGQLKHDMQSSNLDLSVQMSPTSHYGGSFTYRQNGKANLSEECDGCFLAMQKRKNNPCSKEEKVKMELYAKSPRAYRIRMADESLQLCNKHNLSLFSVTSTNGACNSSSSVFDEKWLFYSVSKPSAVFPNIINASLNTTYVISYTVEKYQMVMYSEYDCIKLTVSLYNINGENESISVMASLNWITEKNNIQIFSRAQTNQSWVFQFKKLIPGVNFIVLDFRGGRVPDRVCLDYVSLEVFTIPPITLSLFRQNEIEMSGLTEIGKSIPKMWIHILGRPHKEFVPVHALQFSVFSNTSNQFIPLMVLTANRKLYLQTLSRNPDYSTSSYFEIGHRVPMSSAVHFTISSIFVNLVNHVWEVVFSDASTMTLRLFYTKTMTDVVISKQNYPVSIPASAFRLLPIVVFQAKWLNDHSCELYTIDNKTKPHETKSTTKSDQPPVIGWRQVYAKQFTFYGAPKPSSTSTYRRPPRFVVESL